MSRVDTTRPPVTVGACQGCGACLLTCPEHAIRPGTGHPGPGAAGSPGPPLRVLAEACTGCGECVEVCPVDALDLTPPAASEGVRP